jgi:hypothetical protein
MEYGLFLEISRRNGLQCQQIHHKPLKLSGGDALSDSEVCYWSRQFLMSREYAKIASMADPPLGFGIELRIPRSLEELLLAFV